MDLHDEYEVYKSHVTQFTDWSNPGPQSTLKSGTSTAPGDILSIPGGYVEVSRITFDLGSPATAIPHDWLAILGFKVNNAAFGDPGYATSQPVTTDGHPATKPGQWTYAIVGVDYNRYVGNALHYTAAGFAGEVPFDLKDPTGDISTKYQWPFSDAQHPGGP